ncbi:MAG: hypothetical protein BWX80_03480 [Candidatus Hydrogenedentes bacterium ADurb.Bin101]|jgi:hypothetical protein|nr:MAG: hypothetical protein BWX80_03480 [Candidatus Hydrogenedentes bacterium ADurb.Bin101]
MWEFFIGVNLMYIVFFIKSLLFGDYPGNPLGGGY